ncbi:MAG: glycosyltransferase family 39 protein, partial [Candidatus Zixiibacteriota bacterium]
MKNTMTRVVFGLAGVKLVAHLATAGHYPLHQDELYYLLCGRHPAWSYPDHAPLVPLLAAASEHLVGVDPFWLRLWPAMAGAAMVVLAGWIASRLGGGRVAQVLAALALTLSPLFLISNSLMQTVFLDQFLWTASVAVWVAISCGASQRFYLLLGFLMGLGILAKLTILAWGFGVLVGLLLTRDRVHLRSPWLWMGTVIAAVCAAPVVHWQLQHGWPVLEFISNNRADEQVTRGVSWQCRPGCRALSYA